MREVLSCATSAPTEREIAFVRRSIGTMFDVAPASPRARPRIVFALLTTGTIALAAWSCTSEEPAEPPPLTPARNDAATPDAGDSGGGADSAMPDAGVVPCPGTAGPDPIRVTTPTTSFCIDRSEVTRSQYEAFLATNPSPAAQTAECQWNTTFVPNLNWPDGGAAATVDAPITHVDWCDAVAYCKFAGKQLCKSRFADDDAGGVDQWQIACSRNGERKFPYGATQDLGACNGPTDGGTIRPVMSSPRCEGGYDGIFDMTGNVQEWRDGCRKAVDAGPASDTCLLGGGGFPQTAENQSCTTVFVANRNGAFGDLGFRCCSP